MNKVNFKYLSLILKLLVINLVFAVLTWRFLLDMQLDGTSIYYPLAYNFFKGFMVVFVVISNIMIGLNFIRDYSDKR